MSERDADGEEGADSIPGSGCAWRGARRSGVLLPASDSDTPLLESVKAAAAPRRSSIIKVGLWNNSSAGNRFPKRKPCSVTNKPT